MELFLKLSPAISTFLFVFTIFQIVFGTLANLTVIVTFMVGRNYLRLPSDYLTLSLSAADLLCLVTFLPWHAHFLNKGSISELYYIIYESLNSVVLYNSGNAVIVIAVDRFAAVVYPLYYSTIMTRRTTYGFIVLSWTASIGYGVLSFLSFWFVTSWEYCTYISLIVYHFLPMLLVLLLYIVMVYTSVRRRRKMRRFREVAGVSYTNPHPRLMMTMSVNSIIVVCLFYALFLPVATYVTHFTLVQRIHYSRQLSDRTWMYSFLFLNSCINPFIYACRRKTFKSAFRRAVWRKIILPLVMRNNH